MSLFASIEHTRFELNGHRVQGWSEDGDSLMMPDVELATIQRGADGKMMAISTANRGGPITIKLLPNSLSTKFFMQQAAVLQRGGRVVFSGSIVNQQTGVSVHELRNGVMTTWPLGQTQGKGEAAAREFVFEFETITVNYDAADFTAIPTTNS